MKEIKYFGEKVLLEQREMASRAKTWTIYKITNKENKKIYIGQTNQEPNTRMIKHFSDAKSGRKNVAISLALNKYGKNGFEYEILQYTECSDEADQLEKEYIKFYRSNEKDFGYNLTEGGKSLSESFIEKDKNCVRPPMTLEHKNILIDIHKKRKREPMSERQKAQLSQIMKEKYRLGLIQTNFPILDQKGESHPMFGKTHSIATQQKISKTKELYRDSYAEKVIQMYSLGKTIAEISKELLICRSVVSKILHKSGVKIKTKADRIKRKIYRYSKEGVFIDEWESERDLIRATKIYPSKSLRGSCIFCGGFFFSFSEITQEQAFLEIKNRLKKERAKRKFNSGQPMTEENKKRLAKINKGNNYRGRIENIKQLDENGNLIKVWKDSKEIVNFYGLKNASPVLRVLNGKRKFFKDYKWSL